MMFYVYILKSQKDKHIYTGYTSNLRRRIKEHFDGEVDSTHSRRLLKLVYYEAYLDKKDAQDREAYLKSGGNAKNTLKTQIKHSLNL